MKIQTDRGYIAGIVFSKGYKSFERIRFTKNEEDAHNFGDLTGKKVLKIIEKSKDINLVEVIK